MTDMPEKIAAWRFVPDKADEWIHGGWSEDHDHKTQPYIRDDHVDALIAAIVHVAADKAVDWANGDVERPDDGVWLNVTSVIDADARQALDTLLKAERKAGKLEGLREAADKLSSDAAYWDNEADNASTRHLTEIYSGKAVACEECKEAIEALIEKDATDG